MGDDKVKNELDEAREIIEGAGGVMASLEKQADEKGWDIGTDFEPDEPKPMPKFRLVRKCLVGDTVNAEKLGEAHYNPNGDRKFQMSPTQMATAKLAILGRFDDEQWSIPDIEARLENDFFTNIFVRFTKYLT